MKGLKYALLVGLALTLAVVMSGCAPATPTGVVPPPAEETEVAPPAEEIEVAPPPAEETEAPAEVIELVYMRQAEGHQVELDLVEEFNATHPNIHVTVDSVPAEDNYPKLVLTTEAGNPPDVYMTYFTLGAATNGLALDLTPFIEQEGEEWFNSLSENGWVFHEYAGKYYAVPWRVAPSMVILNTNLLAKAGLEVPTGEWTWEDFRLRAGHDTPRK